MTELESLQFEAVDGEDLRFAYSSVRGIESLTDSIAAVGLLTPLRLHARADGRYRIVCGFRRYAALRSLGHPVLEAIVHPASYPELELLEIAIRDNLTLREPGALEISRILNRLRSDHGMSDDQLMSRYLPLLGLGAHARILSFYMPLIELEEPWQRALEKDNVSLELAAALTNGSKGDRTALLDLIDNLRLGKKDQKEIHRLLSDLARIENCSIRALLEGGLVKPAKQDSKLTPSQRAQRFKNSLLQRRYPRYRAAQQRFQAIVNRIGSGSGITFAMPPHFEGEEYGVSFSFTNENEFQRRCEALARLKRGGVIAELLESGREQGAV